MMVASAGGASSAARRAPQRGPASLSASPVNLSLPQFLEPILVEPEVMADLVQHGDADLLDQLVHVVSHIRTGCR